jgi:transcriptional regulator with XRE-family HTH domain
MPTTNRVQTARFALQMAAFAEKIGQRMRERREELKESDPRWTQDYAARQVRDDLTGAQYARWERGEVMPREDTIEDIAKALGLRVDDLYGPAERASTGRVLGFKEEDAAREIRMEAKLDALLAHHGVDYLAPDNALRRAEDAPRTLASKRQAEPRRKRQRK